MEPPSGIINIFKEENYTSSDVVVIVRGMLRRLGYHKIKVGHTGTLDPMATGVLPICIGKATKSAQILQDKDKAYTAAIRFGLMTDTEDITGIVVEQNDIVPNEETFKKTASLFCGIISQKPPMYSAVKINGQRLYKAARAGEEIERPAREVHIHSIKITDFSKNGAVMNVVCGKGTYIRTLIKDIGAAAGCLACMESLCRTRSGCFTIETGIRLRELEEKINNGRLTEVLIPWNT